MLVGDVASGKTVLVEDVSKIVPNSQFISRRTTSVGLEERARGANRGILAIDEFDKIDKDVRLNLLEAMQIGTITISKHHYHRTIEARISVLANCNPTGYMLNENMPIVTQIPFSLPILSRFHVIVPVKSVGSEYYADIAESYKFNNDNDSRRLKMRDTIIKVRQEIPIVDVPSDIRREVGNYISMLKRLSPLKEIISPRTTEGMLSMICSRARMKLNKIASEEDYEYVRDIYNKVYL